MLIPEIVRVGDLLTIGNRTGEIVWIFPGRASLTVEFPDKRRSRYWPVGHMNVQHRELTKLLPRPPPRADSAAPRRRSTPTQPKLSRREGQGKDESHQLLDARAAESMRIGADGALDLASRSNRRAGRAETVARKPCPNCTEGNKSMTTPTIESGIGLLTEIDEDNAATSDPFDFSITFIEHVPASETVLMCGTGDNCGTSCGSACTTS